jgi:hypothetical protein
MMLGVDAELGKRLPARSKETEHGQTHEPKERQEAKMRSERCRLRLPSERAEGNRVAAGS